MRLSRVMPGRRAFSLVQLMVTIAIVTMLVGLILVGVVSMRGVASRTVCVNNLRQIGLAYQHFVERNGNDPTTFKGDYLWVTRLKPFLENQEQVYWCPLQETKNLAEDFPKAFIRVNENTFPEYGSTHNIPISKDTRRMRLSARYVQNEPPGCYYTEMEDLTDWNWRDLDIKIWPSDDGAGFNVQPWGWSGAAYHFDLIAADGVTMLYHNFKPPNHPIITIPGGATRTSYAISAQVQYVGPNDSEKVLAVEYNQKVVANVFGSSPADFWPTYAALRHRDTLNVLFLNGSVKTMTSEDIDPRQWSTNYPRYWLPASPGPF